MTQDNSYAFSQFATIGGYDYEGERINSLRIFGDYESAVDYARELVNGDFGYNYAYVAGVNPDGTLDRSDVTRVADDEPSVVSL